MTHGSSDCSAPPISHPEDRSALPRTDRWASFGQQQRPPTTCRGAGGAMTVRHLAAFAFAAVALSANISSAQPHDSAHGFPNHVVKILVPFAAGSGTDVLARVLA